MTERKLGATFGMIPTFNLAVKVPPHASNASKGWVSSSSNCSEYSFPIIPIEWNEKTMIPEKELNPNPAIIT